MLVVLILVDLTNGLELVNTLLDVTEKSGRVSGNLCEISTFEKGLKHKQAP